MILYRTTTTITRILPWFLALLCLAAPFVIMPSGFDYANLPQVLFIQTGTLFIATAWLIAASFQFGVTLRPSPLTMPVMAFLFWAFISSLYALNTWEARGILSHWWICGLIFVLVMNIMRHETDCRRLLGAVALAAAGIAIIGSMQHLAGLDFLPQAFPPAATFANKNMAAHFMVLALPVTVALFITSRRPICWLWAVIAVLVIAFLFFTRTRAALLAVAIQIFVVVVLMIRNKIQTTPFQPLAWKILVLGVGVCLIAILVMASFSLDTFKSERVMSATDSSEVSSKQDHSSVDGLESAYTSIGLRLVVWRNTLEMIKDNPLQGFGLGNHKVFYPAYHGKTSVDQAFSENIQLQNVHNDYLQIAAEMGLPGILLAIWLIVVFFSIMFRILATSKFPLRIEVLAVGVAVIGILVNAGFSFPLERAVPPFVSAVFLGITAFAFWQGRSDKAKVKHGFVAPPWVTLVTGAVFLGLFSTSVLYSHQALTADKMFPDIVRFERAESWSSMAETSKRALALQPGNPKPLAFLGRAYVESGEYVQAADFLETFLAVYPYNINALLNLGATMYALDRLDEAQSILYRVLEIKPGFAKAHHNLAGIYARQGRTDKALKAHQRAAELDQDDALIQFHLGLAEMKAGNPSLAADAFKRTVELQPNWELARKNLGIIYAQHLGRPQEALKELHKALEINPGMQDAQQIKALMRSLMSDHRVD